MFKISFAQNFVDKVYRQLGFHVNIMNEKGIIIASSDSERIGDFHIIAHDMIANKQLLHRIDSVKEGMIGVKHPGVNLLMLDGNEPIGVVGVSGNPAEILHVAKTIKFALESMLGYQDTGTDINKAKSYSDKLTYALLMETPLNAARVLRLASAMGIQNECLRFPILITLSGFNRDLCMKILIDLYSSKTKFDSQDIILPLDGQNALFLLSLPSVYKVDYELYAKEVANEIKRHLSHRVADGEFSVRFICGIPQTTLLGCRGVFNSMSWLRTQKYHQAFDTIYLKNYYIEYTVSQIDIRSLGTFFDYYYNLLEEKNETDMFLDTVGAMIDSNMKPEVAATKLFMHKNTVVSRMKKVRNLLGIQPTTDMKDAAFLTALYEYIVMNIK
ncbi:MAG: CdaR family transcriptional regulator [Oscillospiraceae bacterium]